MGGGVRPARRRQSARDIHHGQLCARADRAELDLADTRFMPWLGVRCSKQPPHGGSGDPLQPWALGPALTTGLSQLPAPTLPEGGSTVRRELTPGAARENEHMGTVDLGNQTTSSVEHTEVEGGGQCRA